MEPPLSATIVEHFSSLEDPRIDRSKEHLLLDIMAIAICAVNWVADSWVDMENYGNDKYEWFKGFLA